MSSATAQLFPAPTHGRIFAIAWPIILANIAAPLLGLVDTAVIGHLGTVSELGAIALGSLIFSLIYWGFGFLRMGTTGFIAQAVGRRDQVEIRATLLRASLLGLALGTALVLLQTPLIHGLLAVFDASAEVEAGAAEYLAIRIWGAPAALGVFVLSGVLIGQGRSRTLMGIQLLMNSLNVVLDVWLAVGLDWGLRGIAAGTAISEWVTLLVGGGGGGMQLQRSRSDQGAFWTWSQLRPAAAWWPLLRANRDIMIRTLLMLACFAWFTNAGAVFGDTVLAANHVLLQFITFSAYFLDGFAYAAEALVGAAIGRGDRRHFDVAVRRSTHWALATALALALVLLAAGQWLVALLTDLAAVQAVAGDYLPWAAAYVALSFAAFQLDGVFIAATATAQMRNASLLSASGFLVLAMTLAPVAGNLGLWMAFVAYVVLRAAALLLFFPGLRASVAGHAAARSS